MMVIAASASANAAHSTAVADQIKSLSSSQLISRTALRIERNFTDGLPPLPFDTKYARLFRDLMHHYITDNLHRVGRIFVPQVDRLRHARSLIETLYSTPLYAICVLGNSQTDRAMQSRSTTADRNTQIVYGVLLRVLREQVEQYRAADMHWLLLLVVVLTGLESCMDQQLRGMKTHRAALLDLVAHAGGLNGTGPAKSYVLNTDLFIALCLGEYPVYRQLEEYTRPVLPLEKYGKAFADLSEIIDSPVIDFSEHQCQLIEMLEEGRVDLTSRSETCSAKSMGPNALPSFLNLRDKISVCHANLHARYHDNTIDATDEASKAKASSISRCVLLAGHIIAYREIFGDYYAIMRPMLGSELEGVLQQKPRSDWTSHKDIVTWVLFVLCTIPKWSAHPWAVAELRLWLSMKYVDSWPHNEWIVEEERRLKGFVWSHRTSTEDYHQTCDEVLELDDGLRELQAQSARESKSSSKSAMDADDERSASRDRETHQATPPET